ncbi:STAS domain-containing protein [Streptomyces tendae]|uniref:STAS domain-containing protein n=1 Tax=Streptomyces tendae TaxID=1932 RepID=UPI00249380CB|nr:STAS domain-containing protein [Streptomyces tendae]
MTTSPDAEPRAASPSPGPGRTVRLALTGDLDHDTCGELLRQVRLALREHEGAEELRLDCGELGAVDSMGLSTLLQLHREACRDGIGFRLDDIGPVLKRLLDLTGTYEHLHASQGPTTAADGPHP